MSEGDPAKRRRLSRPELESDSAAEVQPKPQVTSASEELTQVAASEEPKAAASEEPKVAAKSNDAANGDTTAPANNSGESPGESPGDAANSSKEGDDKGDLGPPTKLQKTSGETKDEQSKEGAQAKKEETTPTREAQQGKSITNKLHGYRWYHDVAKSPKFICAPMVDQSELPFRLLCLDHKTDICWTPMINSKMLLQSVDSSSFDELISSTFTDSLASGSNPHTLPKRNGKPYWNTPVWSDEEAYPRMVEEMLRAMHANSNYSKEWNAYNNPESLAEWAAVCGATISGKRVEPSVPSKLPYFVKEWNNSGNSNSDGKPDEKNPLNITSGSITSGGHSTNAGAVLNKFLEREFSTSSRERGKVVAQFCGDNPATVLAGARLIERYVDAIDLNCGCPQGIAKKGHYGSFLLEEPDLICSIVRALHLGLDSVPVTVKIRKVNAKEGYEETLKLVENLVKAGASAVTIHCRVKEEKGQHVREADWPVAKKIKDMVMSYPPAEEDDHIGDSVDGEKKLQLKLRRIPIFCNGGIETFEDATRCMEETGCDGVMSAEALLEDPQLFHEEACPTLASAVEARLPQDEIFQQYLNYARRTDTRLKIVKAHCFHMMYAGLQTFTDLRAKVGQSASIDDIESAVLGGCSASDSSSGTASATVEVKTAGVKASEVEASEVTTSEAKKESEPADSVASGATASSGTASSGTPSGTPTAAGKSVEQKAEPTTGDTKAAETSLTKADLTKAVTLVSQMSRTLSAESFPGAHSIRARRLAWEREKRLQSSSSLFDQRPNGNSDQRPNGNSTNETPAASSSESNAENVNAENVPPMTRAESEESIPPAPGRWASSHEVIFPNLGWYRRYRNPIGGKDKKKDKEAAAEAQKMKKEMGMA